MKVLRCGTCGSLNNWQGAREGKVARCGRCRRALDESCRPQGTGADFLAAVLEGSPIPVLVDFRDPSLPDCRENSARVAAFAGDHPGEMVFLTVDVLVHPSLAETHRVEFLPTLLLFAGGREIARESGRRPDLDRALSSLPT